MFPQRRLLTTLRQPAFRAAWQRQIRQLSDSAAKPGENAFVAERRKVKEHAASTTDLWKKLSIYVAIPCLILAGANAYRLWNEHWEHWSHMPPLEERTEYPFQNIRTKNYPWGNGDETLFWNPKVNYHNKDK